MSILQIIWAILVVIGYIGLAFLTVRIVMYRKGR